MKTILELSKELNISKQAIYKQLTPEFRKKYVTKNNGKLTVSKAGCERLLEHTKQAEFSTNSTNFQPVESEVENLRMQNKKLLEALSNQQILMLNTQKENEKLQDKLNLVEDKLKHISSKSNDNSISYVSTDFQPVENHHWWQFWK